MDDSFRALVRNLGRRVTELRVERGVTQEELAEALDVAPGYVQHIERGSKVVSLRQAARVADALGVSPLALFEPARTPHRRPGRPRGA